MGIVVGTVGMLLSFFMIYKKSSEKVSSTTSVIATDLKNIQSVATIAKWINIQIKFSTFYMFYKLMSLLNIINVRWNVLFNFSLKKHTEKNC